MFNLFSSLFGTFNGTAGNDEYISEGIGFRTFNLNAGNDTVTIGSGLTSTTVNAGAGDDRVIFDFGAGTGLVRTVSYSGGAGTDTLQLDLSTAEAVKLTTSGSSMTYAFSKGSLFCGGDYAYGSVTVDATVERMVITGSAFDDVFKGASGNDWLDGGAGADTFYGSTGDDGYVFDNAGDRVVGEIAGGGNDSIWSSVGVDLRQQSAVENLRLTGSGDIAATGTDVNNLITGNAGSNVITGGAGNDSLYGNGGVDTFVFGEKGAANKDSIWDFDGDDRIVLDHNVFTGLQYAIDGSLSAMSFAINKAVGTAAQMIYNRATGILSYDADGVGAGAAEDVAFVGKSLAFFDNQDIFLA